MPWDTGRRRWGLGLVEAEPPLHPRPHQVALVVSVRAVADHLADDELAETTEVRPSERAPYLPPDDLYALLWTTNREELEGLCHAPKGRTALSTMRTWYVAALKSIPLERETTMEGALPRPFSLQPFYGTDLLGPTKQRNKTLFDTP